MTAAAPIRSPRTGPAIEQVLPVRVPRRQYCKARVNRRVVSRAEVIATGIAADGRCEMLGCDLGDSETTSIVVGPHGSGATVTPTRRWSGR